MYGPRRPNKPDLGVGEKIECSRFLAPCITDNTMFTPSHDTVPSEISTLQ